MQKPELHFLADYFLQGGQLNAQIRAQISDFIASLQENPAQQIYQRNVLLAEPQLEMMLAVWNPFAECAPHDHGASLGKVLVVEGTFEETHYNWSTLENKKDLACQEKSLRRAGDILEVSKDSIHSMRLLGFRGVTLHMYAPAIDNMKVHSLESELSWTVSNDCGAWVPEPQQILATNFWNILPTSSIENYSEQQRIS